MLTFPFPPRSNASTKHILWPIRVRWRAVGTGGAGVNNPPVQNCKGNPPPHFGRNRSNTFFFKKIDVSITSCPPSPLDFQNYLRPCVDSGRQLRPIRDAAQLNCCRSSKHRNKRWEVCKQELGRGDAGAGLSALGVPGVPWHPQIFADMLTRGGRLCPSNYNWHPGFSYGPAESR